MENTEEEGAKDKSHFKGLDHKVTGGVVIRERLIGAEVKEVKGIGKSETKVSYFKGNDPKKWKSGIETYSV